MIDALNRLTGAATPAVRGLADLGTAACAACITLARLKDAYTAVLAEIDTWDLQPAGTD